MKAGTGAVTAILALLALTGAPCFVSTGEEIPQPSPANNTLYLHSAGKSAWMNAGKNQTTGDLANGGYGWRSYSFPLDPALDRSTFLIMNVSSEWIACVHATCVYYYGQNGTLQGLNASIVLKDFTYYSKEPERVDDNYFFRFSVDLDIIKPQWAFNFTFRHIGPDTGMPPLVSILTDGSSYIQIPIVFTDIDTDNDAFPNSIDPDDDNDGWNDTADAYPLDLTRWMKPETAHPTPLWLYASPLPAILAIIAGAVLLRRRRRLRSAEPPHK